MSKSLVKRARENSLEVRKEKIFSAAHEVICGALRATEIEEADLIALERDEKGRIIPPAGWTLAEFKAAIDARQAKKNAPMYLDLAQRNLEIEAKLAALKAPPQTLNIGAINIVRPPEYDVIDVTPERERNG